MNASKENAAKALEVAEKVLNCEDVQVEELRFLHNFVVAAKKRLPSEEAIQRDRGRRKAVKK